MSNVAIVVQHRTKRDVRSRFRVHRTQEKPLSASKAAVLIFFVSFEQVFLISLCYYIVSYGL